MNNVNKRIIAVVTAAVLCLMVSGSAIQSESGNDGGNTVVKYTMYIGLNDKDTYTQLISYEEAERKVSKIALKYVDGFTRFAAKGAYKDEKGVVTYENSLVFQFSSATGAQMKAIMKEVLEELNQNSILLEKEKVDCEFYEGEDLK
jgi:hypothetical protein